jgi:hypothetical protein
LTNFTLSGYLGIFGGNRILKSRGISLESSPGKEKKTNPEMLASG